ncbi:MAG: hypothetical protein JW807_16345 [Spirochaetes bacterium]|nr:hypothetical protein [Spirochaetota bacterium]
MKKILLLSFIGIVLAFIGCKDDKGNEINPLPILALLGNSTLTVTATYNGTPKADEDGVSDGTGKIYVYLYSSLGTSARTGVLYEGFTESATIGGVEETITLTGLRDGEYYMLVFYDYKGGDNPANKTDRYILYNNTPYAGAASKITVSGSAAISDISFDDTYQLDGSGALFVPDPATYSLTVHATYNGTPASGGTGRIHAYLYNTLGTGTRTPSAPVYSGSTAAAVSVGVEDTVTIASIVPDDYYLVVFYDYAGGANADSEGDRYVIYNSTAYTGNASTVSITDNMDITGVAFNDDYTLQPGSLYMTPSATYTLTVNATYTGTGYDTGSGKILVHLYNALGSTPDSPAPLQSGWLKILLYQTLSPEIIMLWCIMTMPARSTRQTGMIAMCYTIPRD